MGGKSRVGLSARADDIGVYIHIPFCAKKCSYCDFHSRPGQEGLIGQYVAALVAEIGERAPMAAGRRAVSVFFGGGTPSLLTVDRVRRITGAVRKNFDLHPAAEISLEANPESATPRKLGGYRKAGVNRISIGVQSLSDDSLARLGRVHTAGQARAAVGNARAAGFANVSADMMFGLPGQDVGQWLRELDELAALGPDHVSCYQLTPEPGTPMHRRAAAGRLALPEDGLEMFDGAERLLRKHGYNHYEVSNYARPGFECLHNLGYWEYRDYMGFGAAAHGTINGVRWANVKSIESYIERVARTGRAVRREETVTAEMERTERLMLGLRLRGGVTFDKDEVTGGIANMISAGFLEISGGRLRATRRGWRTLDSVLAAL